MLGGTACTNGAGAPEAIDDPELEWARELATTDFQWEVLADGVVSRAEYEEAFSLFVSCMEEAGFPLSLTESGGYYASTEYVRGPGADGAFDRCQAGTVMGISGLYETRLINPEGRDVHELVVECLVREGALSEPISTQEFLDAAGYVEGADPPEPGVPEQEGIWSLPFPQDDPRLLACRVNPSLGTGTS